MPEMTSAELAQGWITALRDVDHFYEVCHPDCMVWHSVDNKWMSLRDAIEAVHGRGGLPDFTNVTVTMTENGFICQASAGLQPQGSDGPTVTVHLVQIARVDDGKVVQAEEYIGPEMELAV